MTKADIPGDVRRFVLTSVPSVPYLEAILLLRTDRQAAWDGQHVARRLYVPGVQADAILQALVDAGIAKPVRQHLPSVRYGPATIELAAMLDQLADVYAANLVGVTDLIHSRVDKRAQQFADAFRWRKDS
jgi:hypothetical protein